MYGHRVVMNAHHPERHGLLRKANRHPTRNPPTPKRRIDQRHAGISRDPTVWPQRNPHVANELATFGERSDRMKLAAPQPLVYCSLAIKGRGNVGLAVAALDQPN
jgi:hypothetical protein